MLLEHYLHSSGDQQSTRELSQTSSHRKDMTFNPSYKQLFDERGYVIIPDLIPDKWHKQLEGAAERAIARTRSGEWKHRRTVSTDRPSTAALLTVL